MSDDKIWDNQGDTSLTIQTSTPHPGHIYFNLWRQPAGKNPVTLGGHFLATAVIERVRESMRVEREIMGGRRGGGADLEQVGGSHYIDHKIRPWDIIDEYGLNFYEGNIVKYLLREKPGNSRLEELEKLRHYADKCIDLEKE